MKKNHNQSATPPSGEAVQLPIQPVSSRLDTDLRNPSLGEKATGGSRRPEGGSGAGFARAKPAKPSPKAKGNRRLLPGSCALVIGLDSEYAQCGLGVGLNLILSYQLHGQVVGGGAWTLFIPTKGGKAHDPSHPPAPNH